MLRWEAASLCPVVATSVEFSESTKTGFNVNTEPCCSHTLSHFVFTEDLDKGSGLIFAGV